MKPYTTVQCSKLKNVNPLQCFKHHVSVPVPPPRVRTQLRTYLNWCCGCVPPPIVSGILSVPDLADCLWD